MGTKYTAQSQEMNTLKKIVMFLVLFITLFALKVNAFGINAIVLNGTPLEFTVQPFAENGTVFAPMRTVFETLGASIEWDGDSRSVIAKYKNIDIWIQIDNPIAKVNGKDLRLLEAPKGFGGYTFVPVRFAAEALGGSVEWDGEKQSVLINIKNSDTGSSEEGNGADNGNDGNIDDGGGDTDGTNSGNGNSSGDGSNDSETEFVPFDPSKLQTGVVSDITVNGKILDLPVEAVAENGRVLVPMRVIFETLGASVEWDGENRIVTGTLGDKTVSLQIDNLIAKINGETVKLDAAPRGMNGYTYVPVRFIAETFGADVYWNPDARKIIINTDNTNVYKVIRVIDKTTIVIDFNGTESLLIPLGIYDEPIYADYIMNYPELNDEINEYVRDFLEGKYVYLEFGETQKDEKGRFVAYIFREGSFYNVDLLRQGYGKIAKMQSHIKYFELYKSVQDEARNNKIGLWKIDNYLPEPQAERKPVVKNGIKLCIDPGHGGSEPGAIANGYVEKYLNFTLSQILAAELERLGFEVILTRNGDDYLTLAQRGQIARSNNCDAIISIHFNSFNTEAHGFEAIYTLNNPFAEAIGQYVSNEVEKLGLFKRGVWTRESATHPGRSWYGVLRESEPLPGVILEGLFLDNGNDILFLQDPEFLHKLAAAYAKGICKAYGVEYIE